jgi:hypothetical protein
MSVQYLPPTRDLPPARIAAMRAELEAFVTREEPATRWWRKRRTITGGFVVALIVTTGGGTAAAYAYLHPRAVTDKGSARCYSEFVNVRGSNFPGTTIAQATSTGSPGSVQDALDTCAALWQVGLLRLGSPSVIPPKAGASYPVPALVGCTLSNGVAAVFPGPSNGCDELGLAAESPPAVRAATAGHAGSP